VLVKQPFARRWVARHEMVRHCVLKTDEYAAENEMNPRLLVKSDNC
jgi:hypothetical protein